MKSGRSKVVSSARRCWAALSMGLVLALLLPVTASAQLAQRHSFNVRGDVEMVGNGLLTCSTASGSGSGNCAGHQNGTGSGAQNANRDMVYINTDPVGGSAPANSSTANVSMPAGAIVRSAGLYWSGRSGDSNAARGNIWFKVPGGSYQQLTATAANLHTFGSQGDGGRRPYTAYRDVTSLVSTSGTYAVGGLTSAIGTGDSLGLFGGWALIITYEHSSKPFRRLMVFNASNALQVTDGNPAAATVSGLLTPPSGNFNAYMGALVWEGDDGINGDRFNLTGAGVLNGGSLTDTQSPINNFWNSRISRLGSLFTSRNPAYANNFAVDLKMVDISNAPTGTSPRMANSATTADLEFTSSGDVYFPHALVFISDLHSPNLLPSLQKTVSNVTRPGATDVLPGEQLEYTIGFQNTGQDGAIRIRVTDPIPAGTTYVPGSLRVHRDDGLGINVPAGQPRTDASNDDTAEFVGNEVRFRVGSGASPTEGGMLAQNQHAEVRFRVTVNPNFAGTQITNTVTVSHGSQTFPSDPDQNVSGSTNNNIPLAQNPNLDIAKTGPATATVGVAYDYVITVSNAGAAATTAQATVADTVPAGLTINGTPAGCTVAGQVVTCNVAAGLSNVAPNNTASFTINVTPTAAAGTSVSNTASVTGGGDPSCPVATPCTSPPVVTDLSAPNLAVAKVGVLDNTVVAPPSESNVGDVINYTITTSNTGTGTAIGVNIVDAKLPTLACTIAGAAQTLPADIPAGHALVCTGAYTLTQADIDAATVDNTATATGSNVCRAGVDPACSGTTTTPTTQNPALELTKTGTLSGDESTITYAFSVENTGNVALTNVTVSDPLLSGLSCPAIPTLASGATASFTCTGNVYTVLPGDVNAGQVVNTATASGQPPTPPGGTPPSPVTDGDTKTTPLAQNPALTVVKSVTSSGPYAQGDTISYQFVVTNTGDVPLSNVTVSDALVGLSAITYAWPGAAGELAVGHSVTATATYTVTAADVAAGNVHNSATASGMPPVTPTNPTPPPVVTPPSEIDTAISQNPAISVTKQAALTTDNGTIGVGNIGDVITYSVQVTNTGNVPLTDITVMDSFQGGAPVALVCAPTTLVPGQVATCDSYTHTITLEEANASTSLNNEVEASGRFSGVSGTITVTGDAGVQVEIEADPHALRVIKAAAVREVRIGDLVRYTLTVENVGNTHLVDGSVLDTPPAGFSYVEGSLNVVDGDNAATVSGQHPLRFEGVDVAVGESATLSYLMRVGAGVRPGTHQNQAQAYTRDGEPVSNIATAEVNLAADAMVEESLVFGTVFDDRDSDGWQDSAALTGVRVQGGFAPGAYVANSTTVDRGAGPQPAADASSPLLHGIAVGSISARQSVADPVENHQVVIRQRLSELAFTNDFVLTSAQGVTVKMDAEGKTTVEKSGEAAKGLNAAEPTVERRIAQGDGGYVVDYVVRNLGIDERGIPGVRIASVEGLLMETDQFGRYHLAGVQGGAWERGRNFILKVDPSTLPTGAVFTTDNPLLRRVTPGLPVRFDWGVKLPVEEIKGRGEQVELELGEVIFTPGSAELRAEYLPVIEKIAAKVAEYQGGEVVVTANGHTEALAFDRATAVKAALLEQVPAESARHLVVSLRADPGDPESMVLGLGEGGYLLGKVLFDTDKSAIRPEFEPLLDRVAQALDQRGGGTVAVIGHTDVRGSHAYNAALGLRRAKAVFDALAQRLSPEVRAKLRVDVSNDPAAPAGVKRK